MGRTFSGSTENQQGLLLNADFWKQGQKIEGKVTGQFQTPNGSCYNVLLREPIEVNGQKTDKVVIGGNLKGLNMALIDAGLPTKDGVAVLLPGDIVLFQCSGTTPSRSADRSDMLNFKVSVSRP
jgi:hypothetical protein